MSLENGLSGNTRPKQPQKEGRRLQGEEVSEREVVRKGVINYG